MMVCAAATATEETDEARTTYRVLIWYAVGSHPEVTNVCDERFLSQLHRRLENAVSGGWDVEIEPAPMATFAARNNATDLTHEQLLALRPELFQFDKLFVLRIDWDGAEFQLQSREFDTRVRQWTSSQRIGVTRSDDVADQAVSALVNTFSPVGTIGRPREGAVELRMHAAAYGDPGDSVLVPRPGSLMQVVIRRRRRTKDGVSYSFSSVPWTVLRVVDSQLGVARCEIHSGLRSPLRVRGVSATDRLAIQIRPRHAHTILRLHARNQPDEPLTGYQVFARKPGGKTSSYVGQTDWQGQVALSRDEQAALKIYYIKHGSLVLARLPIVAGHQQQLEIGVVDDDVRLQAEGALKGVQDRLIDAVARREIHAARIGRQLDTPNLVEKNIEQAKDLLNSLRTLPGRNDFVRDMQILERDFVSSDTTTQNRIDRLFRDTRDIVMRNIDPDLEKSLADQISDAQRRLKKLRDYQSNKATP